MEKSIELDCAPGGIRPGDLIEGVVQGLDLTIPETSMRFFGNWKWEFPDVSDERWQEIQPTIKERVSALYARGVIRYGSW